MEKGKELVQAAQESVDSVSCDEFLTMQEGGEDVILLDVRGPDEFAAGHIDGALHIPRGFLEFRIEEQVPNKDAQIVICCASGGRASLAGQTLTQMGYTNVAYLEGGYQGYCEKTGKGDA